MTSILPPAVYADLLLQRDRARALEAVDAENFANTTPEQRRRAWQTLKLGGRDRPPAPVDIVVVGDYHYGD